MKLRYIPFILLLSLPILALAKGWVQDPNTGCKIWTGPVDATVTWDGACVGGKANGKGTNTVTYKKDGKFFYTYKGYMEGGIPNGRGVVTFADGERLEGQFKGGLLNGHGMETKANGSHYEGQFKDGEYNGHGVITNESGHIEGEFKDGKPNGHVVVTPANGDRFEGQSKDGKLVGISAVPAQAQRQAAQNQQATSRSSPSSAGSGSSASAAPVDYVDVRVEPTCVLCAAKDLQISGGPPGNYFKGTFSGSDGGGIYKAYSGVALAGQYSYSVRIETLDGELKNVCSGSLPVDGMKRYLTIYVHATDCSGNVMGF